MGFLDRLFGKEEVENDTDHEELLENKSEGIKFYNKETKKEEIVSNVVYTVIKPKTFEEVNQILSLVKDKLMVTFSIEYLSKEEGQRTVDIISGALRALNGRLVTITERVYTAVPQKVKFLESNLEDRN